MPQNGTVCSSEVRIGHSLNEAESQHVASRRVMVQQCLQQHNISSSVDEVPIIAVLGSGGGERAMIGLLGSLSQLSEEKLLDCIMYLSGVSGSTCCMAAVYKESDWSIRMETVKQNIIQRLGSGKVSHSVQYNKLKKMCERDNVSVTNIWAACFVSSVVKEIEDHLLTECRDQHTNDPYPIYTVIDKHCKHNTLYKDTWFEITPDECGYSLTGAFVDSKCLGSQFVKGAKTEEHPEIDMLYLQGLCGSALADGDKIRKWISHKLQHFFKLSEEKMPTKEPKMKEGHQVLCTLLELNHHFLSGEDHRNHITKMNELLKGSSFILTCIMKFCQWDWGTTYNFLYKMKVDEVHPSILKSKTRQYEDAGLLVNSPYFSVLRKERNVDLIISLDFSDGDPFETVDKAAQICKDLQIPFPTVEHHGTHEEPKDFYVFNDNPNAPTVIHIPFFNAGNCKGEVNMWKNRYQTFQSAYNDKMISDLLEKAGLNITNTKKKLLREIEEVIKKKKEHS
ncbi:cytosolic phospholipase A2 gamma-like [Electrophorus electricus]|uniref:cytosolic phospholipase A2 gamma-like n=1 Tax=Electrophorus electricus TaxID=8005 RepID=UPI0015D010E8|nr:cytosolic phospholipase A2 gamma-like [Electrophorus electricus]